MPCSPDALRGVPLFSLLDDEETAVLAAQVESKTFAARERIYKRGIADGQAYVVISGRARITTVDEATVGEFFGFASMLEETAHQTNATAVEESVCLEISRDERVADGVARFGGSWTFNITFGIFMVAYTTVNILLRAKAWDPYPFILLSQNRQDTKDRLRGELDFDVNRRAASDIQGLSRKLNLLDEKVDDLTELLRAEVRR
jgi:uncharacterized membrane protein